ncbi:MAG: hypothetical protein R3C11_22005 [Planctomycetaceae bacterium]
MLFEFLTDFIQLIECFGHFFGQSDFDTFRSTNTGDDVFPLSVDEVVSIETTTMEQSRGQSDTRSHNRHQVAKDHRLDVGGSARFVREYHADDGKPSLDRSSSCRGAAS